MMEKQKNKPRLRFPEFGGEWERKKLGEVGTFLGGGTPSTQNIEFWNGNIPWISSSDLIDDSIYQIRMNRFITENAVSNSATKIIPKHSILIVSRVGVGKIAVSEVELCTSQDFTNLIPTRDDHIFLAYLLKIKTNKLLEFNQGTSIKGFVKSDLESLGVEIPSLPEQTKIASFLTAVDEKLQSLKKKKDLLEEFKKGVMQKLFSQEIRFQDDTSTLLSAGNGKDFPDWEMKKLGEVAIKRIIKNKDNKIKNVFTNSALFGIVNQRDFFDKDIANQNNLLGYYVVEKDDFIYNPRISKYAPVGPISRNHLETGIMSPLYSVFRFLEGDLKYLEFFFSSTFWYKHMEDISNYGARDDRMSFLTNDFYEMPIPYPSLPEQTKIANFFSALDEKINHSQAQIEKTEIWKKGLLQRMFV
ncbi:restriction endonuclease subunit S [Aquiflexum sp. TKW24L]|uniref:restriction endonuclease subunit S n=1 Tax=Aquiflexum sp. TKW24L TaxID=2942212 RepID=UPI0020BD5292|nr:restriction endonuclease subunit S [Aquiflexum sp. TKW24L]MCL6258048.1 restriction endonuclease subunit S [Aquiflexum sp. TKW24L]